MSKHIDPNNIHLTVDEVQVFGGGITILWSSDIGFGEYTIDPTFDDTLSAGSEYQKEYGNKWCTNSESLDTDDDKSFGKKLLELWMDQIHIIG